MRKFWFGGVVFVGLALWAWPYMGAFTLAQAARRGDRADVAERIDGVALRRSLSRQLIRAYLEKSGKGRKLGSLGRGLAIAVGSNVADPYLAQLVTPDTITTLLGEGRFKPLTVENRTISFAERLPRLSDLFGSAGVAVVLGSYYDGVVDFVFNVPDRGAEDEAYGVHLRLAGSTWKLSGVDLPRPVLDQIVDDIMAKEHADPTKT